MGMHVIPHQRRWKLGLQARIGVSIFIIVLLLGMIGFLGVQGSSAQSSLDTNATSPAATSWNWWVESGDYVVLGWNDLGMHCINPTYKDLAILPPYNNLWVQVIKRGEPPRIVKKGISVEYTIRNNTTVNGKTDFWTYIEALFGRSYKNWPLGVGLTGTTLSGKMKLAGDHFQATGIPLLPYNDKLNWNPYQLASITVRHSSTGRVLRRIRNAPIVLPISDEINCAQCHAKGMDGTVNINGGTDSVDANILAVHDYYWGRAGRHGTGPDLSSMRPVLCASCHPDNALKPLASGNQNVPQLSRSIHGWHAQFPDAGCYSCHPGEKTQCQRTAIGGMGYQGTSMSPTCPSCHGQSPNAPSDFTPVQACMLNLAETLAPPDDPTNGRQAWLGEPSCEQCHGVNYTTGGALFRNSKGHGGVYCAGCHNSPHAWWPSKKLVDNYQPLAMQNSPRAISDCKVCHLRTSFGTNPHVTYLFNK